MNESVPTPLRVGRVRLNVNDLDRVRDFYRDVVGLKVLSADRTTATLGTGSAILLELRGDASLPRHSPQDAGLFHTAFLLPTRADLGRWLMHARHKRIALDGAADHLVSEALYLSDPEGNGIEIYADRPPSQWTYADGMVQMANEQIDFDGLVHDADGKGWTGFPERSTIGHVHLQVGAIEPAEEFYSGLLGLNLTCRYPGGSFYAAGGYHHHLATNIWNSRGARERVEATTGLADVELITADVGTVDAARARIGASRPMVNTADGLSVRDPWGTSITIRSATG